jgi:hypothetical protein
MATPHIAGLAAYLLGLGSAPKEPVQLCSYIAEKALSGVITQVPRGTDNKLANNGFAGNSTQATAVKRRGSRKGILLQESKSGDSKRRWW